MYQEACPLDVASLNADLPAFACSHRKSIEFLIFQVYFRALIWDAITNLSVDKWEPLNDEHQIHFVKSILAKKWLVTHLRAHLIWLEIYRVFHVDFCNSVVFFFFFFVAEDEQNADSETCGKALIILSWVVVCITMPFSLFVCFKVSISSIFNSDFCFGFQWLWMLHLFMIGFKVKTSSSHVRGLIPTNNK